jgi:flagellar protein FlaG
MIIPGVDPIVLNQIQNKSKEKVIQDSKETILKTKKEKLPQTIFTKGEVEESVKQLNKTADLYNISLRFQIDEEDGQPYVLVIDRQKGKIVRRIPPDKAIKMSEKIKFMVGLMVDELV